MDRGAFSCLSGALNLQGPEPTPGVWSPESTQHRLPLTDIPHPVFPTIKALRWHHLGKLWVSLTAASRLNELPTSSCMEEMTEMRVPDHSEKKTMVGAGGRGGEMVATSYLHTLVLMLRVWKVLGCLSEEDVSTTWHSVQKLSKIGFMTNNVRGGKGETPRLCCSYRDYQVIMHAFIYLLTRHCEVFTSSSIY